MTVARVLPDVVGLDRTFDYLVPDQLSSRVQVGSIVRIPLHGRRVGGWVLEIDADGEPAPGAFELKAVTKVTGLGPPPELVDLAEWAAVRWAGRRRVFLTAASPHHAVIELPPSDRTGTAPGPSSPASSELLRSGGGVIRLPPTSDPLPAVLSAVALGPTIVVVADVDAVRLTAARLRRHGLVVAAYPEQWAQAAAGVDVVIGARSAAWAPLPHLAAVVVIDEHDEHLQAESSPTWHARDVAVERCRRLGVPILMTSPVPSAVTVHRWRVARPTIERERAGWPIIDVVDRTGEEPWKRSLVTSQLITHLRDHGRRVVCVSNTTGRARLLACRSCRAIVRCEACDAALGLDDDGSLRCRRCASSRPAVCARCGAMSFANLRPGVTRLREELEAAAGRAVSLVTGDSSSITESASVFVGTEAVLHRVRAAEVVAFLDLDSELLAPRYRAWEQTLALVARAARIVGPRARGGRILLQTFVPDHEVIRSLVLAEPGRVAAVDLERRRRLGLPPFGALAEVAGTGADAFVAALRGVDVGGGADRYLVRAADDESLGSALRAGPRPAHGRLRLAVDPPRV